MLPRVALILQARRRRIAFEAQLAEAIDLLVGALRAGYGFLQAMEAVTKEIGDPMREEFVRVIDLVKVGTPPADALLELPKRIDSYDLSLFVTAVTVQRTIGGNLAEVLENIAETVRERRRIRAEVLRDHHRSPRFRLRPGRLSAWADALLRCHGQRLPPDHAA